MIRFAFLLVAASATAVSAQTPTAEAPIPQRDTTVADSSARNVVTAYAIRSGRLALTSEANPGQHYLPDESYTNDSDIIIAFVDGAITRIQQTSDAITEIAYMRLNRDRQVRLLPSTNALMAVSDIPVPSGTFRSQDGKTWITFIGGHPTAFGIGTK